MKIIYMQETLELMSVQAVEELMKLGVVKALDKKIYLIIK